MGLGEDWRRALREGHGEVQTLSKEKAERLAQQGVPILTGLSSLDREQNSIGEILRGGVHELVAKDRDGKSVTIGALPDDFATGRLFDGGFTDRVQRCVDVAVPHVRDSPSQRRVFCDIARQRTAATPGIEALEEEAPEDLEEIRAACDDVAKTLGAETHAVSTDGVESLSASRMYPAWSGTGPRPCSLPPHHDRFAGDGRIVWSSKDTEVFFGCCPYSRAGWPMPNGTHGKLNPIETVGYRCGVVVTVKAQDAYWLSRAGSGNEIVFIELVVLADGTELYIPYKRAHAVLGVEEERDNVVVTLGRTGKTQDQLSKDVQALLRRARPASTPSPPAARPSAPPPLAPDALAAPGGFREARPLCRVRNCGDDACLHPGAGGGRRRFDFAQHWSTHCCIECEEQARKGVPRARPTKRARRVQSAEQHFVSYAHYGPPGASVPTKCGEHKSTGDVLIVNVCGEEDCTKYVRFTRSADATCDGAHGYCPDHVKDRKGYYRCAADRCYGGDGECSKQAAHHRVAGAVGAGAAGLCPEHFAGLDDAARKQYARSLNGCDNCSSGQRRYVHRDNADYGLCPACYGVLVPTERRKWWRVPWQRCGDGTCGACADCPRLDDAPPGLPERLCPAHLKKLPPDARRHYKPPKKKMCDLCGDRQAVFFDDDGLGKMRCATHALDGTGKNKRKRESCVGLKRVQSKRCGDGTCHADGSQGVQLIGDPASRLCGKCGTEGKGQDKRPIAGYEFRGQALSRRGGRR